MAVKNIYNNVWENAEEWLNVGNSGYPDGIYARSVNNLIKSETASFDMTNFDNIPIDAILTGLIMKVDYHISNTLSDIELTCTATSGVDTLGIFFDDMQPIEGSSFELIINIEGLTISQINNINVNVFAERSNDKDNAYIYIDAIYFIVSYEASFNISLKGLQDYLDGLGGILLSPLAENYNLQFLSNTANNILSSRESFSDREELSIMGIYSDVQMVEPSNINADIIINGVWSYGDLVNMGYESGDSFFYINGYNYQIDMHSIDNYINIKIITLNGYEYLLNNHNIINDPCVCEDIEDNRVLLNSGSSTGQIDILTFDSYNDFSIVTHTLTKELITPIFANDKIVGLVEDGDIYKISIIDIDTGAETFTNGFDTTGHYIKLGTIEFDGDDILYWSIIIEDIAKTYKYLKVFKVVLTTGAQTEITGGNSILSITAGVTPYLNNMVSDLSYCRITNKLYLFYAYNHIYQETSTIDKTVVYEYSTSWNHVKDIFDFVSMNKIARGGYIIAQDGILIIRGGYSQASFGASYYRATTTLTVLNTLDNSYNQMTPTGYIDIDTAESAKSYTFYKNKNYLYNIYKNYTTTTGNYIGDVIDTQSQKIARFSKYGDLNNDVPLNSPIVLALFPMIKDNKWYFFGNEYDYGGTPEDNYKFIIKDFSSDVIVPNVYIDTQDIEKLAFLGNSNEAVITNEHVLEINHKLCYFSRIDTGLHVDIFDGHNFSPINNISLSRTVSGNPDAGWSFKIQYVKCSDFDVLIIGLPDIYYDGGNPYIRITHTYIYKFKVGETFELLEYVFGDATIYNKNSGGKDFIAFNIKKYIDDQDVLGINKLYIVDSINKIGTTYDLPFSDVKIIECLTDDTFGLVRETNSLLNIYKIRLNDMLPTIVSTIKEIGTGIDYNSGIDNTTHNGDLCYSEEYKKIHAILSSSQDVSNIQTEIHSNNHIIVNNTPEFAISNPTSSNYDYFGRDLCGDNSVTLLISADSEEDGADMDAGVVHVFNTATKLMTGTITNPNPTVEVWFGNKIFLNNDYTLITSIGKTSGDYNRVHLYQNSNWTELENYQITRATSNYGGIFINDDYYAFGDPSYSNGEGIVKIYNTSTRAFIRSLTIPGASNLFLGKSILIDGDLAYISSYGKYSQYTRAAIFYIFDITNGNIVDTITEPEWSGGSFGENIILNNDSIILSQNRKSTSSTSVADGKIHIYDKITRVLTKTIDTTSLGVDGGKNMMSNNNKIFYDYTGLFDGGFNTEILVLDLETLETLSKYKTYYTHSMWAINGNLYIGEVTYSNPPITTSGEGIVRAYTLSDEIWNFKTNVTNKLSTEGTKPWTIEADSNYLICSGEVTKSNIDYASFFVYDLDTEVGHADIGVSAIVHDTLIYNSRDFYLYNTDSKLHFGLIGFKDQDALCRATYINYVIKKGTNRIYSKARNMQDVYSFTAKHAYLLFTGEGIFLPSFKYALYSDSPIIGCTTFLIKELFGI